MQGEMQRDSGEMMGDGRCRRDAEEMKRRGGRDAMKMQSTAVDALE